MKIKDLAKVDRPREKLVKYGPDKLSTTELLAILLRTGTKQMNVIQLANKMLKTWPGEKLQKISITELKTIHGIGETKACEIVAMLELGRRLLKDKKSALLLSPQDVWNELRDIRDHKKEHFVVFFLDSRNQEIKREVISVGTLNANLVHPREVFEPAIKHNAAQIIIAHNHPSGDPEPSPEDIAITKRLVEAGTILGIEILDHVIVAKQSHRSLKEQGII
ncbi:MAG: DNA repair protein RadC [Candidatus Vogelbacteria bacterium]|nr:DNA repair protein RadC [Candidatus Vogelbacteria bacterium]